MSLKYRFFICKKDSDLPKKLENLKFVDKTDEYEEVSKLEKNQLKLLAKAKNEYESVNEETAEKTYTELFDELVEQELSEEAQELWELTHDNDNLSKLHIHFSELPFNEDFYFGYFTHFRHNFTNIEYYFIMLLKKILEIDFMRIQYSGISNEGLIVTILQDKDKPLEFNHKENEANDFEAIAKRAEKEFNQNNINFPSPYKFHEFIDKEFSKERSPWENFYEIKREKLLSLFKKSPIIPQ